MDDPLQDVVELSKHSEKTHIFLNNGKASANFVLIKNV